MTTTADLAWWLDLAPRLRWTEAVTYRDTAPHWYIVEGRTPDIQRADFVRAGRVIRRFGQPRKFYSMTNLYLLDATGRMIFWAMWSSPPRDDDATLINLARADLVYGAQRDFDDARVDELRDLRRAAGSGR